MPTPPNAILQEIAGFHSRFLDNQRTLQVFLPEGFDADPARRYPVLYANDGQDLKLMGLRKILARGWQEKDFAQLIVVAIPANDERLQEYGTAGIPNADGMGAQAQAYTDFIVQEVVPYIDLHYPTLAGPHNRVIMGWSLGGLSAFDIAWNHPELFGKVGVFSGSFWWRTAGETPEERQAARIVHDYVHKSEPRPGMKFWFEAGTADETADRDHNGVIDAIQDTTELMDELAKKGYDSGTEMTYVQVEDGRHELSTWSKVLPEFLRWAFPSP